MQQNLDIPKVKASIDDKVVLHQILEYALDRKENIIGKGSNSSSGSFTVGIVW